MSELLDNLNEIELQKASFIIPKNLKKNVSALGVTGTLEYLDTTDATAQAKDIKEGQTAYVNDVKITGNLQYEPSDFSLNGITGDPVSTELKTSGNTKYIQLKYKRSGVDTIVGGSANVITHLQQETMAVASGITADKIKKDVEILGVTGSYEGVDTSDANATVDDLVNNKTAYVNGAKIVGTLQDNSNLNINRVIHKANVYSDLSSLSLDSGVTSLLNLFDNRRDLKSVPNIQTGNILNVSRMLGCCSNLVTIPNYNLSNAINMAWFVNGCGNLVAVPNFNTVNVTNMLQAFGCLYNITEIPNFNTSNVTEASFMLYYCNNLKSIPNFNTINVVEMRCMLSGCHNITEIPNFNTSNVISMYGAFESCYNITSLPNLDTSKVVNMKNLCWSDYKLHDVPVLNTSNVTNVVNMFFRCNNLSNNSVQNIVDMCINSNVPSDRKNLSTINEFSPLYNTKFNSSYYSNRLTELTQAGWSY